MSAGAQLTVHPDGHVTGLYTEAIDLHRLGRLQVERFTTIEFDNALQVWRVDDANGVTVHSNASRRECLDWEEEQFNQKEKART